MQGRSHHFPLWITAGFGTAVAMWLIGFLTHLPGVRAPGIAVAGLLIGSQLAGGAVAALWATGQRAIAGLGAGFITGLINLLIVGSVVASDEAPNALRPGWTIVIAGTLGFSAVIGAIGAALVRQQKLSPDQDDRARWPARFAVVTVLAAIPVVVSGGLVTSKEAGLAVPDWPTSYGANMFLFPLSKMTGGIYYEHAHRLFGTLIGLTTLTLCTFIVVSDRRRGVKVLGIIALLAVIAQGVLGGTGVTQATSLSPELSPTTLIDNDLSRVMRMVHGITAQVFLAYLCGLAAVLSTAWRRSSELSILSRAERLARTLSFLLVPVLLIQLMLGSMTRHLHSNHAMFTHIGFALVALVLSVLTGFRTIAKHKELPPLRRLGHAVAHTALAQVVLGLFTLIAVAPYDGRPDSTGAVLLATAHQGVGAALLAFATMLALWHTRRSRQQS